jgi:hypothetical protein
MKRHCLTAIAAVWVLALVSSSAKADLLTAFAGNTQPMITSPSGSVTQGFINFAVYNTVGGTLADPFNSGISAAALAAFGGGAVGSSFLYVFQDVNVHPPSTDIASGSVNVNPLTVTGSGLLAGLTYTQVGGAATFLGPAAAVAGNFSPEVTGATAAQAKAIAGAVQSPSAVTLGSSSLVATFATTLGGTGPLPLSSLWGYTSNIGPATNFGSVQDGGIAANGTIPANIAVIQSVPEPSSLAICVVGALGMIGYGLRRRNLRGA